MLYEGGLIRCDYVVFFIFNDFDFVMYEFMVNLLYYEDLDCVIVLLYWLMFILKELKVRCL